MNKEWIFLSLFLTCLLISSSLLSKSSASTLPDNKIYSVCEMPINGLSSAYVPNNIVGKTIMLRARIGKSFHFGVTLRDTNCQDRFVRIVFPIPDPKGIQKKFRFLDASYKQSDSERKYMACDCRGSIKVLKYITIFNIDDATINAVGQP